MQKILLKVLSLILCLALSLTFFGCNDNGGSGEKDHECLKFVEISNGAKYEVMEKEYCDCAVIEIPSVYKDKPVTSVGMNAFWECTEITSLTIPKSIKSLGDKAFGFCINLKSLTVPNSITTWGGEVFACTGIETLVLENGLKAIGPYAFKYCNSLTQVIMPSSIKTVGSGAFVGCEALEKVIIGSGVKTIESNAFSMCGRLNVIEFDGTVEQWNAIEKGTGWNADIPALYVNCTNGYVNMF